MNVLKEKGMPFEKQWRDWHKLVVRPFDHSDIDCYSRTRQILMNGIEVEAWGFKHSLARLCPQLDNDDRKLLARIRRIEDIQETTVNYLTPAGQSVLDTTLGYEQVAVDLTAWLSQNEPDKYVKETYDFGLLEDFDHLYRYSQWGYMMEGADPNHILQHQTDVVIGRPTQFHHNCSATRLRKPYDKDKTNPQTKVNILTLVSAEQQTHNFYAEHGMMYPNDDLRRLYGEIGDVEEEHVSMYESLIDPNETPLEKLVIHEFTEICNYYNCYKDEVDDRLKLIWEEFMGMEIEHLHLANELLKKHEKRDAEEIIGTEIIEPSHFESQKDYVTKILTKETGKRLDGGTGYAYVEELPKDWVNYDVQNELNRKGAPSEQTIHNIKTAIKRDIVSADKKLVDMQPELLKKAMQSNGKAPNTITIAEYEKMTEIEPFEFE